MTDAAPGAFTATELLDTLGQAVIATDLDGTIVYWNDAAERLYGWPSCEALGRNVADVTVPHISQDVAADIMKALRDGTPWSGGFPVQRRDGSVFPALVTDSGIYRDGALIGIVGVSSNLGIALQPLLERSTDAAIVVSAVAVVTYASPAVTPLFGWHPDELIGKPLMSLVHPKDQEPLYDLLQEAPGPGPGRVIEIRLDAGDSWIPTEATLTNLLDDPVVRGIVCNLRYSERLARLKERERISRPLHGEILQTLFGATLDLDAVVATVPPAQQARIEAAIGKIAEAIATMRRIVSDVNDDGPRAASPYP